MGHTSYTKLSPSAPPKVHSMWPFSLWLVERGKRGKNHWLWEKSAHPFCGVSFESFCNSVRVRHPKEQNLGVCDAQKSRIWMCVAKNWGRRWLTKSAACGVSSQKRDNSMYVFLFLLPAFGDRRPLAATPTLKSGTGCRPFRAEKINFSSLSRHFQMFLNISLKFLVFSKPALPPTPQSGAGVALAPGSDGGGGYAPVGPTLLLSYQLQPKEGWFLLGGKIS